MSLRGKGSTLRAWKFSKLLGNWVIDTREGGIGNGSARDHVRLYLAMQVGKPFDLNPR